MPPSQLPAPTGYRRRRWLLRALVAIGTAAMALYLSWWFQEGRLGRPALSLFFALATGFCLVQLLPSWWLYLLLPGPRRRSPAPAVAPSVDVLLPVCREPLALVERCVRAALALKGAKRVWLLDDGAEPALAEMARRLGCGYLARGDSRDGKAGNLNAALARTRGELIAIFDVDHAPAADFLEHTVGFFGDPEVGVVQVAPTFSNRRSSWLARAAHDTTLDFHNPISEGMDRLGAVTHTGTNAVIRRSALESIGRYRPGLADDLATSMALHAAGWKSVYVRRELAPGLLPETLDSWFVQQSKWARGVFEVLLVDYPRCFRKLGWAQRIAYLLRLTYYLVGVATAVHVALAVGVLAFQWPMSAGEMLSLGLYSLPLAVSVLLIRRMALALAPPLGDRPRLLWRGYLLVLATWPAYLWALLRAMARAPVRYQTTPKERTAARVAPMLHHGMTVLLLVAALAVAVLGTTEPTLKLAALLLVTPQIATHGLVLLGIALGPRGSGDEARLQQLAQQGVGDHPVPLGSAVPVLRPVDLDPTLDGPPELGERVDEDDAVASAPVG